MASKLTLNKIGRLLGLEKSDDTHWKWRKRGGYAHSKIEKTKAKLTEAGFKEQPPKTNFSPDGSTISSGRVWVCGNMKCQILTSYGSHRFDNSFSIVLWEENK